MRYFGTSPYACTHLHYPTLLPSRLYTRTTPYRIFRPASCSCKPHSPSLIIDPIPKPRCIHHRQTNPHPILFQLDIVRLDLDRHFVVRVPRCLADEARVERRARVGRVREERGGAVREQGLVDEGVDEGGAASSGCAWGLAWVTWRGEAGRCGRGE